MTRRELLAAGGVAALAAGCAPIAARVGGPVRPAPTLKDPDRRLLDRLGYGPSAEDADRLRALGPGGYLQAQLAADAPEPARLTLLLSRADALQLDAYELRDLPEETVLRQLQSAALLRAVYSPNGLRERTAEFWTDHFCVFGRKGLAAYRLGTDQARVVRAHALGSFPEMLRASARSPAMLAFLDNWFNSAVSPNENYARELLELHTLGVHGGYTQRDVMEVARCFSGWGLQQGFLRRKGAYRFDPERHDDGPKTVLGTRIPAGGGERDGEIVLDLVARHPATARHLAGKLARRFLGEEAPKPTARAEAAFRASGGDVRATLSALFEGNSLLDAPPILRRPFDFVAAALRATGATTDGGSDLLATLRVMGQPLYEWPMPDGYPTDTAAWTGTMLARWRFVDDLSAARIPGTTLPDPTLALAFLGPGEMWR